MKKSLKNTAKLGLGGITICGICCAPLIASFFVGIAAVGMFTAGKWFIAVTLVGVTIYFLTRSKRTTCGDTCPNTSDCCSNPS
jgi:hypothetical protein